MRVACGIILANEERQVLERWARGRSTSVRLMQRARIVLMAAMHFIPTSSSWLNLVERWFREITGKRIRRGVFTSVERLIQAITAYIDQHNQNPTSFVWTAKLEDILPKVRRAKAVLDNVQTEWDTT